MESFIISYFLLQRISNKTFLTVCPNLIIWLQVPNQLRCPTLALEPFGQKAQGILVSFLVESVFRNFSSLYWLLY